MRRRKGFALIELLVVISIIAMLLLLEKLESFMNCGNLVRGFQPKNVDIQFFQNSWAGLCD